MNRDRTIEGAGLRVTFRWLGDRFGHTISLLPGDRPLEVATSIEGDDRQPWPASPPFQELHLEQRPGGVTLALLVGRAGTSHWSASCQLDRLKARLTFDVACRLKEVAPSLASTYRIADRATWEHQAGPSGGPSLLMIGNQRCRIDARCRIETPTGKVIFQPPELAGDLPATVRWEYEFT